MDDEDEMVNFPSCWVGGSVGRCVGTAIGDKLYGVYENRTDASRTCRCSLIFLRVNDFLERDVEGGILTISLYVMIRMLVEWIEWS